MSEKGTLPPGSQSGQRDSSFDKPARTQMEPEEGQNVGVRSVIPLLSMLHMLARGMTLVSTEEREASCPR